jgi:hypothetical protein
MRMQPCEARLPIDHGSEVPWIPIAPPSDMKITRSGLRGSPGGIVWPARLPAHALFGTCQAGFQSLPRTRKNPPGVPNPAAPTATPYVRTRRSRLKSRSRKLERSIEM